MNQELDATLREKIGQLYTFVQFILDGNHESLSELLRPTLQFLERLKGKQGKKWLEAYKRFLRDENPFAETVKRPRFDKLQKQHVIIGGKTMLELTQEIYGAGMRYTAEANAYAKKVHPNTKFGEKPEKTTFFIGELRDFFNIPSAEGLIIFNQLFLDFYGLELCSPEDAFYLRAHYKFQQEREFVYVGMKPVTDQHDEELCVFQLGHQVLNSKGQVLDTGTGAKTERYLDLWSVSDFRTTYGGGVMLAYRLKKNILK